MQGGEQFSLGGALFGWPHAGECASPDEHAPEAWLLLFRNKHATSDILYAAMTACKAGRELWTEQLQTAPSATLTLDFSSDPPAEDGWERLGAARRALKTRGPLPTALVVKCNEDGCPQHGLFSALPHALAGCGQHITSVTLTATQKAGYPDLATASALVRGIAAVCPNMTSLAFDFPCLLPPPALLPSLTHLKIDLPLEPDGHHGTYEVFPSIVPVLPQVSHFDIGFWGNRTAANGGIVFVPWGSIFCQASTTHTLTHLVTHETLTNGLVWMPVLYAPALRHLTVSELSPYKLMELGEFTGQQWGVTELVVTDPKNVGVQGCRLEGLPASVGGVLNLRMKSLVLSIEYERGIADMLQHLATWRIALSTVTVKLQCDVRLQPQSTVLSSVLQQISVSVQPEGPAPHIELRGWQWPNDSVLQFLETATSMLPQYRFSLGSPVDTVLTDELLSGIVAKGDRVHTLWCHSISLQSDQHGSTAWPGWERLWVGEVEARQVLRLPSPPQDGVRVHLSARELHLSHDLTQAETERTRSLLQSPCVSIGTFHLHGPAEPESQAHTLSAQLSVLRAAHSSIAKEPHDSAQLLTSGLHITHKVMDTLQSLPVWGRSILLSECTWPLEPAEYKRLAQCIPVQYRFWYLGAASQAVLDCVCEGVPTEGPEGMGPLRITYTVGRGERSTKTVVGEHLTIQSFPTTK